MRPASRERVARRGGFAYQPALDGVRAVAVAAVLLFHAGFGWMSGGYVGVSVFFTLSGFLITSLPLVEHERTGRLDARAFYARRVRRLLPASLACLAGVFVLASAGAFDGVTTLRRDVWAALVQVFNWVSSPAARATPSSSPAGRRARPLDHYWSLAIEEQFYWVWPLVLVGRAAVRSGAAGSLLVGALPGRLSPSPRRSSPAVWGPDAAYWATPARLSRDPRRGARSPSSCTRWRRAGPRCPAARLAGAGRARRGRVGGGRRGRPARVRRTRAGCPVVRRWPSAALVVGLQVAGRRAPRCSSARPLVALGAISYGVYLYHWPVYVVLDEERTGLPDARRCSPSRSASRWPSRWCRTCSSSARCGATTGSCRPPPVGGSPAPPRWRCWRWRSPLATKFYGRRPRTGRCRRDRHRLGRGDWSRRRRPPPVRRNGDSTPGTVPRGCDRPGDHAARHEHDGHRGAAPPGAHRGGRRLHGRGDGQGRRRWASEHPGVAQVEVATGVGCGFIRNSRSSLDDGNFAGAAPTCRTSASPTC